MWNLMDVRLDSSISIKQYFPNVSYVYWSIEMEILSVAFVKRSVVFITDIKTYLGDFQVQHEAVVHFLIPPVEKHSR